MNDCYNGGDVSSAGSQEKNEIQESKVWEILKSNTGIEENKNMVLPEVIAVPDTIGPVKKLGTLSNCLSIFNCILQARFHPAQWQYDNLAEVYSINLDIQHTEKSEILARADHQSSLVKSIFSRIGKMLSIILFWRKGGVSK